MNVVKVASLLAKLGGGGAGEDGPARKNVVLVKNGLFSAKNSEGVNVVKVASLLEGYSKMKCRRQNIFNMPVFGGLTFTMFTWFNSCDVIHKVLVKNVVLSCFYVNV